MAVALPGDLLSVSTSVGSSARLGPGLLFPDEQTKRRAGGQGYSSSSSSSSSSPRLFSSSIPVIVTKGGVVGSVKDKAKGRQRDGETGARGVQGWWIEGVTKRYLPSPSDPVIARITSRNADFYTLSLSLGGSSHTCTLPTLAFEGATKRNKPNLKIGALIYGMLTLTTPGAEAEVTCVDPSTGKSNGMGELEVPKAMSAQTDDAEQYYTDVIPMSLNLARALLRPSHPLLPALATHFPFESALGANGLLWVKVTQDPQRVLAVRAVINQADAVMMRASEYTSDSNEEDRDVRGTKGQEGKQLANEWGGLSVQKVASVVRSILE